VNNTIRGLYHPCCKSDKVLKRTINLDLESELPWKFEDIRFRETILDYTVN
jgi:hypothetical protein